ncbi:MAG: tetratricopeptide repeat protein [Candidatus Krumholzibacteriia bacterium]
MVRDAGRLDQAESLMLAFLRDHPDDLDMRHDLAVLQGQRGRWPAAEATALGLQAAAPDDARGWLDQAMAQVRQGRPGDAAATLRRGLAVVPGADGRRLLELNLSRLSAPDSPR